MKKLLFALVFLAGCGDVGSSQVQVKQSQNDPKCEASDGIPDCVRGTVLEYCDDQVVSARDASCDECPDLDRCAQ